jgi:DDE family transposase
MVTIPDVATAMRSVLTETADVIARETGCHQRASKLGGGGFVRTLVFGWLGDPEATLERLAQAAVALGTPVTPQALDQRFTPEAAACLEEVLAAAVRTLVAAEPAAVPLLRRFSGVYVQDSSTLRLPDALAELWAGCGGRTVGAGQAALKLEVRLELGGGLLDGPYLAAGRTQDKACARRHRPLPAGALRLADLGYFSLGDLRALDAAEVYWLSRYKVGPAVFEAGGRRQDVAGWLQAHGGATADLPITLGAAERLPCRLLAARVPPEVATARRRKLKAAAKREGKTPSQERLALCDWIVLVTNAPPALLSVEEALVLGRARWQIELLFKLWKQHGQLDASRSTKPWRVLCELYAKLIALVVQHWLLLLGCWAFPDRSLPKAAQTVRAHATALAGAFARPPLLRATLATLARCLAAAGRIHKRRAAPATFQLLLAGTASQVLALTPAPACAPAEAGRAA